MKKCAYCGRDHDGEYGEYGEYCSKICRRQDYDELELVRAENDLLRKDLKDVVGLAYAYSEAITLLRMEIVSLYAELDKARI